MDNKLTVTNLRSSNKNFLFSRESHSCLHLQNRDLHPLVYRLINGETFLSSFLLYSNDDGSMDCRDEGEEREEISWIKIPQQLVMNAS